MNESHILNGDALKDRFPSSLDGKLIVARECLVDGDVSADTLAELFQLRASYLDISNGPEEEQYRNKVIPEFKKIMNLAPDSIVNLWFEDDLFCQVNLWFVSSLIEKSTSPKQVFLVRPHTDMRYGFGCLNAEGLAQAYASRSELSTQDIKLFSTFWRLYQQQNHSEILQISMQHLEKFPFLEDVAKANLERFPNDGQLGRPEQTLIEIMNEIGSKEFGPVFQEFHKRESIYGFGDLQVKNIFDKLTS